MAKSQIEVERKYELADLESEVGELDWSALTLLKVRETVCEHLEASYLDTPSRALGKALVALRRRVGGYDQGWHIKYEDKGGQRHELHYELLEDSTAVPSEVSDYLAHLTLGQELTAMVSMVTERQRTVLEDAAGVAVAEVCEDSVLATDFSSGIERAWKEWEVELLEEGAILPADIFADCEKVLFALGIEPSASAAKIARALGQDADFEARRAGLKN